MQLKWYTGFLKRLFFCGTIWNLNKQLNSRNNKILENAYFYKKRDFSFSIFMKNIVCNNQRKYLKIAYILLKQVAI